MVDIVVRTVTGEIKQPRIHGARITQQPLISVLTDFGRDEAIFLVKSAIRYVNPDARVEDLTHEVPAFNILSGAWRLSRAVTDPTQKEGSIYVAVVDPGVGGERACLVVRTRRGKYLVGPDNGLLSLAFQAEGIETAVAITNTELTLRKLAQSVTFDGKDVFGPAAAHLAAGVDIREFGDIVPEARLRRIVLTATSEGDIRRGSLVDIDQFGALRTDMPNHVNTGAIGNTARLRVITGGKLLYDGGVSVRTQFEDAKPGELLAVLSSTGCLDIAANLANASTRLGIGSEFVGLSSGLRPITTVELHLQS